MNLNIKAQPVLQSLAPRPPSAGAFLTPPGRLRGPYFMATTVDSLLAIPLSLTTMCVSLVRASGGQGRDAHSLHLTAYSTRG